MEQTCVELGQLYRSDGASIGLLLFILIILFPFSIFTSVIAKRKHGLVNRAVHICFYTSLLMAGLVLLKLFIPAFLEPNSVRALNYSFVLSLALGVLYLFLTLTWIIGAIKTRFKPREFEVIPAILLFAILICSTLQVMEAINYVKLRELPQCERNESSLPSSTPLDG